MRKIGLKDRMSSEAEAEEKADEMVVKAQRRLIREKRTAKGWMVRMKDQRQPSEAKGVDGRKGIGDAVSSSVIKNKMRKRALITNYYQTAPISFDQPLLTRLTKAFRVRSADRPGNLACTWLHSRERGMEQGTDGRVLTRGNPREEFYI
ncbi:hypothetical protein RUM43_010039 [Polyplax serrata]|uniref:Uncharacterized protein n=1 Tax=Polyplax serrata TaxID=468196 RepID=A0AAN8P3H8_POLSC